MKRIYLIGYMGAGKSLLGKILARQMNMNYIDTDHFIENRYRKKVSDIFAAEGEERFRDMEHRVLLEISAFEDVVISTGGGLPCFNDNITIMNNTGITVFLDVPVEELATRLETSKNVRPVLMQRTGRELVAFIEESLAKRRIFYEQSKIRLNAGRMNTKNEVEHLAKELESLIAQYKN